MLALPEDVVFADFYSHKYDSAGMPDTYSEKLQKSPINESISSSQVKLYGNITIDNITLPITGEDHQFLNRLDRFPGGKRMFFWGERQQNDLVWEEVIHLT